MLYIIVNTTSQTGKAKERWKKVRETLDELQIPYKAVHTKYPGHARELAGEISDLASEKAVTMVVFGGDGTINEVLNGIKNFENISLGVIPAGSGNDFARGAGVSFDLVENITGIISKKHLVKCDIGRVTYKEGESRIFGISSGFGMDAIVCKKANESKAKVILNKLGLGKLTYLVLTVKTLFSMDTMKLNLILNDKEDLSFEKAIFLATMNLRAEGGGVPMAPKATAEDGTLTVSMAHGISKWKAFTVLPLLVFAKHENLKCFYISPIEKLHVSMDKPMTLHADGEYLGEVCDAEYECLKGKLNLLL